MLVTLLGLIDAPEMRPIFKVLDFPSAPLLGRLKFVENGGALFGQDVPKETLLVSTNVGAQISRTSHHIYRRIFELSRAPDRTINSLVLASDFQHQEAPAANQLAMSQDEAMEMNDRVGTLLAIIVDLPRRPIPQGWERDGLRLSYAGGLHREPYTPAAIWNNFKLRKATRRTFTHYDSKGLYMAAH